MNKMLQDLLTNQQRDNLDCFVDLDISWSCLTVEQMGFVRGYVQACILANEHREMSANA